MPKFLFIYRNPAAQATQPPSPEQIQQVMAMWREWFAKCGSAIVDGGDGLMPTGKVVKSGGVVTDGPFIESKEMLGGYTVIQADTYEKAVEIAKSCPVLLAGGHVEVRQLAGFN